MIIIENAKMGKRMNWVLNNLTIHLLRFFNVFSVIINHNYRINSL